MRYINGLFGVSLVAVAFILVGIDLHLAIACAIAAVLAFVSCRGHISKWQAIVFASASAVLMFYLFGYYLIHTPSLASSWYLETEALPLLAALFGGFSVMVVLSEYSCFMKGKVPKLAKIPLNDRYHDTVRRVQKFLAT